MFLLDGFPYRSDAMHQAGRDGAGNRRKDDNSQCNNSESWRWRNKEDWEVWMRGLNERLSTKRLHSPVSSRCRSPNLLRHPGSFSSRYSATAWTRGPVVTGDGGDHDREQSSMRMQPARLMPPMMRDPALREAQAQQRSTLGRDTILLCNCFKQTRWPTMFSTLL